MTTATFAWYLCLDGVCVCMCVHLHKVWGPLNHLLNGNQKPAMARHTWIPQVTTAVLG